MKRDTNTGNDPIGDLHYYYLHTNGELIHKSSYYDTSSFEESDFVVMWWILYTGNRFDFYTMLIRAKILGAKIERINELVKHWRISDTDYQFYVDRVGLVAKIDGNQWFVHAPDFVNLQESTFGHGDTMFNAVCSFYEQVLIVK